MQKYKNTNLIKRKEGYNFFVQFLFCFFSLFSDLSVYACFELCPFLLVPSTCYFTFIWTLLTQLRICSDFFSWLFSRVHSNFCRDCFLLCFEYAPFFFLWMFLTLARLFFILFHLRKDFFYFVFIVFSIWFFCVLINIIRVKTNNK